MTDLRIAVIGCGHLGRIHARLLQQVEGVQLAAVVDPAVSPREQAAEQFQTAAFAHCQPLLGKIDAAVLAAPTGRHHAVGMQLLEHGVHLLIEKPIAPSLAEAAQLTAAARQRRLVLQVGHIERFNPAWQAALPSLARPKYIEAVRASGYTFRSTDIGVVLDLMIHDLDLVLSLVGSEVVGVEALGLSVFGGHEDVAQARLCFANGCVANLSASRASFHAERRIQVFAERAYAAIDLGRGEAKLVRPSEPLLRRQLNLEALTDDQKQHVQKNLFRNVLRLEELPVPSHNAILEEQKEFVEAIRTGAAVRVSGDEASAAVEVAERILDHIDTHHWTADSQGPTGPLALPGPRRIPEAAWPTAADQLLPRRKAG